ncbi:hypothetical protein ANCDUO_01075 [Ancylostoma duodenale]|uniref:Uncharacterized protein n=1 Tax=Ancylostoma duodenale TaxID=51022 RepID=A0A0C2DF29_9BILA|nr:hypothetical protein ANCDUO_01075 [Ancylostoma duodenale]
MTIAADCVDAQAKRGQLRRWCERCERVHMNRGCNIVLLILGLAAAGLAGSQFSNVRIYNYR